MSQRVPVKAIGVISGTSMDGIDVSMVDSLIALNDRRHLGAFRPLAVAGHVSLFPLLFTASEFPVKVAYTIFWLMAFLLAFDRLAPA